MLTYLQGMVEAGDTVSATLKKEFGEEAMNSLECTTEEKKEIERHINTLFHNGEEVRTVCILLHLLSSLQVLNRSMLVTWMTLGIQTTPGWKQLHTISMTKQVRST